MKECSFIKIKTAILYQKIHFFEKQAATNGKDYLLTDQNSNKYS